jgi:hypothetical protein
MSRIFQVEQEGRYPFMDCSTFNKVYLYRIGYMSDRTWSVKWGRKTVLLVGWF